MHLMIRIENRLSRERDAISSSRLSIRSCVIYAQQAEEDADEF